MKGEKCDKMKVMHTDFGGI